MDVPTLRRVNLVLVAVFALVSALLAASPPWGGWRLALWSAAPILVFVAPVLAFTAAAAQRAMLFTVLLFGAIAMLLVAQAANSSDAFSAWAAWVVPAVLFVGAVVAAGCGAAVGTLLARRDPAEVPD
jgi:hypothetical protein